MLNGVNVEWCMHFDEVRRQTVKLPQLAVCVYIYNIYYIYCDALKDSKIKWRFGGRCAYCFVAFRREAKWPANGTRPLILRSKVEQILNGESATACQISFEFLSLLVLYWAFVVLSVWKEPVCVLHKMERDQLRAVNTRRRPAKLPNLALRPSPAWRCPKPKFSTITTPKMPTKLPCTSETLSKSSTKVIQSHNSTAFGVFGARDPQILFQTLVRRLRRFNDCHAACLWCSFRRRCSPLAGGTVYRLAIATNSLRLQFQMRVAGGQEDWKGEKAFSLVIMCRRFSVPAPVSAPVPVPGKTMIAGCLLVSLSLSYLL